MPEMMANNERTSRQEVLARDGPILEARKFQAGGARTAWPESLVVGIVTLSLPYIFGLPPIATS